MTATPVLFYGINAAPPFNGPLTISETTPGDVNTASFFDASNNPVNQGIVLGDVVKFGYAEIGESTTLGTDYFFLDGKFLGNTSDSSVSQVLTDLQNAYTNDIVNGGNNTAQLAIDDAAIESGRLGVPVSTINEPFFDSAGHLVQNITVPPTVSSGQTLNVSSGQTSNGVTVLSGGTLNVLSGGTASNTLDSGGSETVSAHGIDHGALIRGGTQYDYGSASGDTIYGGGFQIVESGGIASGTTINGGTLEVASGGSTGSGPITFTSAGGDLQLDASQSFHGLIAGFASPSGVTEEIDLRDIAFGNSTHLTFKEAKDNLSGTLTVRDGSHTATLTLLGQYSAANFSLASDGHGGTFIIDPQTTASTPALNLAAHA
jgi:autotransporter passenger strand-loop-strand repeat protein